ncbi:MAG: caspase family protein [Proteobacteria bacterium]|nr:caspase family protein [Pseudomonadota bacterium]
MFSITGMRKYFSIRRVLFLLVLLAAAVIFNACVGKSANIQTMHVATQIPETPNYRYIKDLSHSNANTRLKAVKNLGMMGERANDAVDALINAAAHDQHPNVRTYAVYSLIQIAPANKTVAGLAVAMISDPNYRVRSNAIKQMLKYGYTHPLFLDGLNEVASRESNRRVKQQAMTAYQKLKVKSVLDNRDYSQDEIVVAATDKPRETSQNLASTLSFNFPKATEENRLAVAVIIGNKNYKQAAKNVPDVDYAHNDADAMYKYVTETLGYREGNVMLMKDATQADFVATFGTASNPKGKLSDWIREDKSDVFIFYSGHGAPSLKDGSSFLLPVDSDPMKVELNGYPLETFYANLAKLSTRKLTVVLDACFSGSSSSGTVVTNASSISLKVLNTKAVVPGATIITAADISEIASWDENARHGLFTRHFIEGVTGKADNKGFGNEDGKVDLAELKNYLNEEVTYKARRLYGRDQHPQVKGDAQGILSVLK